MNKAISLIFPHQLYWPNPILEKQREVLLVEEKLFFTQFHFHQLKLVLHRASMQYYYKKLIREGFKVRYTEAISDTSDCRKQLSVLLKNGYTDIHLYDPTDDWLKKRIVSTAKKNNQNIHWYDSPNFLNTSETLANFFSGRKHYHQTDFYISQRKQQKILLADNGNPLGGKWTYDSDNRAKIAKGEALPICSFPKDNEYVRDARKYVAENFAHHYGDANTQIAGFGFYPTTHTEAQAWLHTFLEERFEKFGIYEDAMQVGESTLFHSVLTPMLNIGLLHPKAILDAAISVAAKKDIPLNSLEGFVRQIMGWREFIRGVYEQASVQQRTTNFWGFTRKIPSSFWEGKTGIVPVDDAIQKLLKTGYNHHIERLMILGNFMLLCEFDPNEVYRWFMEMYIDAYDWVMVPNIYGMTQFADGGLMTTKPYISGSNYIMKMSNYPKGSWQEIWDALFWRFMHVHRDFFLKNPRLGMLIKTFDKMPKEKKNKHLSIAENYLNRLT